MQRLLNEAAQFREEMIGGYTAAFGRYLRRVPGASGVIANGAIFALMDSTAGIAVVTGLRQSMPIATIDMRLDYLHPPAPFERLIGRAQCYKYTRSMAFVRGLAYQDSIDHPVANMVGSFVLPGAA